MPIPQVVVRAQDSELDTAVTELRRQLADWMPALHGDREYMLCCAMAGQRLRFYAVKRGGWDWKAVSQEFDRTSLLSRLEVSMHSPTQACTCCFCIAT